jgi:two-component sensor histidine kinase
LVQADLSYAHDANVRRQSLVEGAERSATATKAKMEAAVAVLEAVTPDAAGAACAPRLAALIKRLPDYENLLRVRADGSVDCVATPLPAAAASIASSPWFQRLRAGDAVAVSAAPELGAKRRAVLTALRSSSASGRFQGATVALIATDSLRPEALDPSLPADTQVSLIDSRGHVAASTAPERVAPPPKDWRTRASTPKGLIFTANDRTGAPRTEVIAPLVGQDLYVILSAPAPRFLSWARLNAISNFILPLMGWIGAWLAVWIVTDRVVIRWLSYLDRIASIYAKGRFSVRPVKAETAPQEIRALAQTLDAMADAIVARDLSLRESLLQKDTLMREIHHRVKNNLQIITSLLNMQQRALKDPAAREAMSDTRQRITALALIYRALYQSPDLRRVDVRQFLEELIGQLSAGDGSRAMGVRTELAADDLEIDPDKLAPLALFAVEAIAEARKHGFTPGEGTIHVAFHVGPEMVTLEISDDGDGPSGRDNADGVGRTLMGAFARQLRGRMEKDIADGRNIVRLIFPVPDQKPLTQAPFQLSTSAPAAVGNPMAT